MEVVNLQDKDFYDGRFFIITMGSYGGFQFKVYANSDLVDTLDILGAYCKEAGYTGLLSFDSYNDLLVECDNDDDIFNEQYFGCNGGEYYLRIMDMHVEEGGVL